MLSGFETIQAIVSFLGFFASSVFLFLSPPFPVRIFRLRWSSVDAVFLVLILCIEWIE